MVRGDEGYYTANRLPPNGAAAQGEEDPMLTDFRDYYLVRKSESFKFFRMADDLHNVANYLNEMRICFLLLTGTVYIILAIYFISFCVRRNRRQVNNTAAVAGTRRLPNHRWDLQGDEYQNALTAQTNVGQTTSEDLVSVRSDGALPGGAKATAAQQQAQHGLAGASQFGMAGRAANRQAAPPFMRHSGAAGSTMQNHSGGGTATAALLGPSAATARLMADSDTGTVTKQQPTTIIQHHHGTHQQQQQQPSQHQQEAALATTTTAAATRPACLLNHISEEKEGSSGSNTNVVVPQLPGGSTMASFGVRSREKILMERHELQPMTGGGGGEH